ncbi:hypothetical protein Ancab_006896 [Ancistrocladus abbreviatus]
MAAALENHKKKGNNNNNNNNNRYVYKFGTAGSQTPEYHPTTVTKRVVSISKGWGLRKSKNNKDTEDDGGKVKKEGELVVGKGNYSVDGWKSMSSVQSKLGKVDNIVVDRRKSVEKHLEKLGKFVEGRKSVSHVESGFALTWTCDGFVEAGRKSISSVESELLGKREHHAVVAVEGRESSEEKDLGKVGMLTERRKSVSHAEGANWYRGKFVEGGRKSMGHVESENVAAEIALQQVKVLVTDMPGFMQMHAYRCARLTYDSLEKFSAKHVAYNMKKCLYCMLFDLPLFLACCSLKFHTGQKKMAKKGLNLLPYFSSWCD